MIAGAVRLARAGLRTSGRPPAGPRDALAFNRRFHMKDGTVAGIRASSTRDRPAGRAIDPDVPVIYFEMPDAAPLAVYVNYAMHQDTVGGTGIRPTTPECSPGCSGT
jgi:hypothetical protein